MDSFKRELIIKMQINDLKTRAHAASVGLCGRYTRLAIEAGGLRMVRSLSARNMGPSLLRIGYEKVAYVPYKADMEMPVGAEAGDVAVFAGPLPHGHAQMFDGSIWISDFRQLGTKKRSGFWPAYHFLREKYQAYRLKKGS